MWYSHEEEKSTPSALRKSGDGGDGYSGGDLAGGVVVMIMLLVLLLVVELWLVGVILSFLSHLFPKWFHWMNNTLSWSFILTHKQKHR